MAGIYKAYDVRGIYPDQIHEEVVRSIGLAFRQVLDEGALARSGQVVVSRDMRSHSEPLSRALIEGLRSGGLGAGEGLVQIRDQIVDGLQADG